MNTPLERETVAASTNGALDRLAALADEMKLANLRPQIAACRHLAQARNGIDVAVFGRFKAGKSSFLNHLAGRAVLPIGVVPLTAVITRLRYSERERAEVQFLDGTAKAIPLADIGLYVGENQNPNNAKQVAAVEIELPELKPLAPLQFVDTPGLGSAFAHNTEVALNWLPNVGAALVAVSSDAPLSERDLELIAELRRHTPKIVLLLTKADLLTEAQRAEVREFVTGQLRRSSGRESAQTDKSENRSPKPEGRFETEQLGTKESRNSSVPIPLSVPGDAAALPVFFYSIKPELAALRSALLAELFEPLREHRGEAGGQILRHKLASLRDQVLDYLRVALAAATQAESARTALREKLAEERRQFGLLRQELAVFAHEQSAGALDGSLAQLQPTQRALQARITAELRAQFPSWKLRLPPLLDAWRAWLNEWLRRELAEVSRSEQAMFCAPLERTQAHLTRTLQAFHDRLAGHVKAALGVTLAPRDFALEVRRPEAPPVQVAYAFDAAFTSVGWLIPLTIFRRPIERVLLRKARYEVEKNLSRLAADWRDRVEGVILELRQQTELTAQNELEALEQMLEQTTSDAPGLRGQIEALETMSLD
jgi:GTP-binding protein EngB required for normal cell division